MKAKENKPSVEDNSLDCSSREWDRQMAQWKGARSGESSDPGSAAFWNGLDIWEAYETYTTYTGALLDAILNSVPSENTVLDIGAGSGGLTIPIAGKVGSVTAVEPSLAQSTRLQRAMKKANLSNISVIPKPWEDITLEEAGPHDVVIAGYSLFMENIQDALWKMVRSARKRVFIIHLAGHDLQPLIRKIRGSQATIPDHSLLLQVLNEMGLDAEVSVFDRHFVLPLDLQLNMFRSAQSFTESEIDALRECLEDSENIRERKGKIWIARHYKDALISIRSGVGV